MHIIQCKRIRDDEGLPLLATPTPILGAKTSSTLLAKLQVRKVPTHIGPRHRQHDHLG